MEKFGLALALGAVVALSACGTQPPAPPAPMALDAMRAAGTDAADRAKNPVICVPGFIEPAALFNHVGNHLKKQGYDVTVLPLFPHLASVEDSAKKLEKLVNETKARTGAKQVDLIAHSKGGLVARYYLKFHAGTSQVGRLIAIASPNHGVPVPVPNFTRTIDQVKSGSPWMKKLNADDETPGDVKYTTLIGALDPIVIPHSTSDLEGARNHRVTLATHISIVYSKKALSIIDSALGE